MTLGAGLVLALLSAFALNWGWLEQHGATQELPALSGRTPTRSLRLLFGNRTWLVGFVVGLAGWALYSSALALAPLSLVQATSAGGIGILAAFAQRRGVTRPVAGGLRRRWRAFAPRGVAGRRHRRRIARRLPPPLPRGSLSRARVAHAVVAGPVRATARRRGGLRNRRGHHVRGGRCRHEDGRGRRLLAPLVLVPAVLACRGSLSCSLQLGFQRGRAPSRPRGK